MRYDTFECIGVWGPSAYLGEKAEIQVSLKPKVEQGQVAVAVFRYEDRFKIQRIVGTQEYLLCSKNDVDVGVCTAQELGKFHVINGTLHSPILNEIIYWGNPAGGTNSPPNKVSFNVKDTGFYCIFMSSTKYADSVDFDSEFAVINPYGRLPAIFYPALPFYMGLSIFYSVIGFGWLTVSFLYWKDLLPIQHYVSGVIGFLVVEMAFNYGFFENYNATGRISHSLLVIMVILNAARNSISFFMLLIVCLGYGVVKPTLGATMRSCVFLACMHFVFGAIYGSSILAGDANSATVLLSAVPLSMAMTSFFMWILNGKLNLRGLSETKKHLQSRRQGVKLAMYVKLNWILRISVFMVFVIIVANMINMSRRGDEEWIVNQWKWRWMLLDGAMQILYLLTFVSIAYLWIPTRNNERYGLDQLATDDLGDEFYALHDYDDDTVLKHRSAHGIGMENDDEILEWAATNIP